jgi:hypothetical protein
MTTPTINHGRNPTMNIAMDLVAAVFLFMASISSEFSVFDGILSPYILVIAYISD